MAIPDTGIAPKSEVKDMVRQWFKQKHGILIAEFRMDNGQFTISATLPAQGTLLKNVQQFEVQRDVILGSSSEPMGGN